VRAPCSRFAAPRHARRTGSISSAARRAAPLFRRSRGRRPR
jgi:hypothetical protein